MLEQVKSYFRHYRSERRGVIVLASIVLGVYIAIALFDHFYHPQPQPVQIVFLEEQASIDSTIQVGEIEEELRVELFDFNPNELSDSGYKSLGFSEKEISTLRNYMATGATFEVKTDFAKLFFVDEKEYNRLEPYIDLPLEKPAKSESPKSFEYSKKPKVKWSDTASTTGYEYLDFSCDLNTADTNELKRLKGVGSFYANKIVERREELGGFHSLAQLLELWKMTPEKIDKFADQIYIGEGGLKRMSINNITAYELSKHPYVSFGVANKIVLFREEKGSFSDSEALCATGLLDADLCRKLAPYLIFD